MSDIYFYFAIIYIGMTAIQIYAYLVSGKPASLLFAVLVAHFAITHYYMVIFLNRKLLEFPVIYGTFPFLSVMNLTWGIVWFLYKMNERRISRYIMEFIPTLAILLVSIPAIFLPVENKLDLANRAILEMNPLLMPNRIPVFFLFLYMIHMIYTIQRWISKNIQVRKVFEDFKKNGYKFTPIITIYFGLIITLIFIGLHMLIVASGIFQTSIIYLYLPGAWIVSIVFLQILENYLPFKDFNKRYAKTPIGYTKSQLRNVDLNSLGRRLEALMQDKKIYRNENLTLQRLARHLDVSPQQLSEFLNTTKNPGYREYISHYRIEEAKNILLEKPEMNASLVGFEVGFPSISGFYKIFKKQTGMSPADFRKEFCGYKKTKYGKYEINTITSM